MTTDFAGKPQPFHGLPVGGMVAQFGDRDAYAWE
jgi:hypothetical protein